MANDILSDYGNDSGASQKPRASNGGVQDVKPIPYSPPRGPSNINDPQKPGLNGTNCGTCGTQGRH